MTSVALGPFSPGPGERSAAARNRTGDPREAGDPRITGVDRTARRITVTADEALVPRDAKAQPRKRDAAAEWLREVLANGPVAVTVLQAEAKAVGFSWATLRRAGDKLGITAEKTEFDGGWAWRLPDDASPGDEIEL